MTFLIKKFRLFCCIANSLEDSCLSRIGAANDQDTKTRREHSNFHCSSPLSFYILCSLEFGIGKRHLSLGCLRWSQWWRIKVSAPGWAVYCLVTSILVSQGSDVTHSRLLADSASLYFRSPLHTTLFSSTRMEFPTCIHFKNPQLSSERFQAQIRPRRTWKHAVLKLDLLLAPLRPLTKWRGKEWVSTSL